MAQELARHGYNISPGTLYPMLHTLEKKGYLKTTQLRDGKSLRTMYRATPLGKKALRVAERRVRELLCELVETKS
jgi:DNA-binding PadR family transcriptional regulator